MDNIKFHNLALSDDIVAAKLLVNENVRLSNDIFHRYSSIYRTTNENISHEPYIAALKDRKKVLSITASGDQIINSILYGGEEIKAVDVSSFPKYFVALKLAAIKSLDREEYLQFIFGKEKDSSTIFPFEIYKKVRKNLDESSRRFWDEIIKAKDKDASKAIKLFYPLSLSSNRATILNPYLQDDNYDKVKEKLDDVSVDFYEANILDVKSDFGYFDLILLSNVINYIEKLNQTNEKVENEYNSFFRNLPLEKNGLAVAYNFVFNGTLFELLKDKNFKVYKVDEHLIRAKVNNEIVVFENKPKILSLIRKK